MKYGKDYPFILTTNRDLEHYNCGAMTRRTCDLEIHTKDVLWINPDYTKNNEIANRDITCLESPRRKLDLKDWITYDVNPRILSTMLHFQK